MVIHIYSTFNFKQAAIYNISADDHSYSVSLQVQVSELEDDFLTKSSGVFC